MDLGMAEATLDQKRSNNILLKNGPNVTQRTSSDSILLRILISANDVTFDDLNIDDFGVSTYVYLVIFRRPVPYNNKEKP